MWEFSKQTHIRNKYIIITKGIQQAHSFIHLFAHESAEHEFLSVLEWLDAQTSRTGGATRVGHLRVSCRVRTNIIISKVNSRTNAFLQILILSHYKNKYGVETYLVIVLQIIL